MITALYNDTKFGVGQKLARIYAILFEQSVWRIKYVALRMSLVV